MTNYVAMIRGVGPENPNMRGARLKWAFEELGFTEVRPFLTSGNVLITTPETNTSKIEQTIETGLPKLLDFSRDVFVRSQADLQAIVDAQPFGDRQHQNAGKTYLTVTFFKFQPANLPTLPHHPAGKAFELLTVVNGALCCVVDLEHGSTTDLMPWLERKFSKHITTRTYNTVSRLLAKSYL